MTASQMRSPPRASSRGSWSAIPPHASTWPIMSPPDPGGRRAPAGREVLRRRRWPLTPRLGTHTAGDERSRYLGPGVEYADVREYEPSEDARLIDWNLTARSDSPFLRQSHQARGLDGWVGRRAGGRDGRRWLVSRIESETADVGAPGQTDLATALERAGRLIRRPSLVIVISDFLVESGWQLPMKSLALRHDVVAARVSDP